MGKMHPVVTPYHLKKSDHVISHPLMPTFLEEFVMNTKLYITTLKNKSQKKKRGGGKSKAKFTVSKWR